MNQQIEEKAKELLGRMPIGNARIFCQNLIDTNEHNPALAEHWKEIKKQLDKVKSS